MKSKAVSLLVNFLFEQLGMLDNNTDEKEEVRITFSPQVTLSPSFIFTIFQMMVENIHGVDAAERERIIDNLPTRILKSDDAQFRSETCTICLRNFNVGERVKTLPCCHHFHCNCIDPWFETKLNCPTCRHSLQPNE